MGDEKRRAEVFAEKLKEIFGESLISVVLYGSAARGDYRLGTSDLNLLVIAEGMGIVELRGVAPLARDWVADGNPPPLMLSEAEWRGSADVFALEYSDIRDAHVILAGRNPFEGVHIRRDHLRHQVEHEFRSKKIQLREGYLAMGEVPEELGHLLVRSLSSFLTLFRALLRMDGRPVPRENWELIEAAASHVGFPADPLLEVLRARESGETFEISLDDMLPAAYLAVVEQSVAWLDVFEPGGGVEEEV